MRIRLLITLLAPLVLAQCCLVSTKPCPHPMPNTATFKKVLRESAGHGQRLKSIMATNFVFYPQDLLRGATTIRLSSSGHGSASGTVAVNVLGGYASSQNLRSELVLIDREGQVIRTISPILSRKHNDLKCDTGLDSSFNFHLAADDFERSHSIKFSIDADLCLCPGR